MVKSLELYEYVTLRFPLEHLGTRTGILDSIDLRLAHLCFLWSCSGSRCRSARALNFKGFEECLVRVSAVMIKSSARRRDDGYNITNLNEALSSLITSMLRTYRKEHRRVVDKMKASRKGKLRGAFGGRARKKASSYKRNSSSSS